MKKNHDFDIGLNSYVRKCILMSFLLLGLAVIPLSGNCQNKEVRLTLKMENAALREIFDAITKKTGYDFVYSSNLLAKVGKVSVDVKNELLENVVKQILKGTGLGYKIEEKHIIVSPVLKKEESGKVMTVTGIVKDENGESLPGVTVLLKGTSVGCASDMNGKFTITVPEGGKSVLEFTFIGMKKIEMPVKDAKPLSVTMEAEVESMDEVVVNGLFTQRKNSYTGAVTSVKGEELLEVSSTNVLKALAFLVPGMHIVENNEQGSNPNAIPEIILRGTTALPVNGEYGLNTPLIILDGVEISLEDLYDLNMQDIEHIDVLKDASAKAIYGEKAANGVIVVETVKPEAGKLQVSYNGNMNISIPDLSSYNLMNSREKLEFELLAGRYDPASWSTASEVKLNELYNEKLKVIESGVNTYWLAEPLRVGVNQKHSLYVQGGEGNFLFGLGAGYNGISGVMEKSDRSVLSGNIDLIYRMSKFQFSNKFSLTSTDYKNPIVAFYEYAEANPYYKKYNDDGTVDKWLENNDYFKASNPLWNAKQNSRDEGKNLALSNYFMAEYFPTTEWRVRARLGLTYGNDDTEKFYSRNDTRYENVETTKKGEFHSNNVRTNQVEAELSVTYAKVLGKHRINLVAGGNISSNKSLTQGYSAVGFPDGDFSYPSFSNGYPEYGTPAYYESVSRSVNGYFNAGYSFDDRYLMDFSLRTSGSSVFGTSRRYNTTWSVGLGWNLHKEKFIMDHVAWINILKLRASIGNPGNQSFDSAQSLLTYSFQFGSMNYFGIGAELSQIGNPDLEWQITVDKNIGLDVTLFNKRFSLTADYYYKVTDPLLIKVSTPLSSGTSTYMTNAGEQVSQGLTASVSYYIFQNFEKRFSWMVRANVRTQKTRIDKIGNKLSTLNASGKGENTVRYYDGADPDDIWAVRSAGIDPSNGKELFYAKDGGYTYDFTYDDEVICGNTRPDVEGVIGSSLNWKGFSVSLNFRYQMGADVFNEALYNKVENISRSDLNKNQDKRALYERWQEVGDIVHFKDIASAETTPMSSRFVQEENVLTLESLYLGYEFYNGWIEKLGLSSLKLQFSMRDVFRASTIRSERGISYPFARSMEAGLSFNF